MDGNGQGASIKLIDLRKSYEGSVALNGIDLTVAPGEFLTLLGPSGSGKTTTLNLIAGFITPSSGEILVDGRSVSAVPPHRRNIGVVFQSYALFPHMTVEQNVSFPLEQRKMSRRDREAYIDDALDLVSLKHLRKRYPKELSGGQQQRVALARALVFRPRVLLLDEPFGALDKRLRQSLQFEIKRIHRELGITFVFVTHDQEEALAMSDRVAVFNDGRIVQVDEGQLLYDSPDNLFAATFLGDSNVWEGELRVAAGEHTSFVGEGFTLIPPTDRPTIDHAALVLRPESITVYPAGATHQPDVNRLPGTVLDVVDLGARRRMLVSISETKHLLVDQGGEDPRFSMGEEVVVQWQPDRAIVVAPDGSTPQSPLSVTSTIPQPQS